MNNFWIANNTYKKEQLIKHIEETYEKDHYLIVTVKTGKQRSLRQNSALHLWCEQVSSQLNEQGHDVKAVLKHKPEIPWNREAVKNYLWKPILATQTGNDSTSKANKIDYITVYEILNKYLGENLGIHIPWPVNEESNS